MPSGWAAPTSMVLMSVSVFVSNIETGLLLVKPWPDFGSTAAPFPPTPAISPTGDVGIDIVPVAFTAEVRPLQDPVRPAVRRLLRRADCDNEDNRDGQDC